MLIKCSECGKEISDKASACIHCGCPISKQENTTAQKSQLDFAPIITLYKSGNKLQAVKDLTERTGMSLKEAKDYLDNACREHTTTQTSPRQTTSHESTPTKRCSKCGAVYPASDNQCPSCKGLGAQVDLIIDSPQAVIEKLKKRYNSCKKTPIISLLVTLVMFVLTISLLVFLATEGIENTILTVLLSLIFVVIPLLVFISSCSEKGRLRNDIELAERDFEAYKRLVIEREQKHDAEMAKMMQQQQQANIRKHPTCPMCGSNNTSVIGKLDKNVSFMLWGVGTDKVGKQYQCKTCHHKW